LDLLPLVKVSLTSYKPQRSRFSYNVIYIGQHESILKSNYLPLDYAGPQLFFFMHIFIWCTSFG